ncbi:MAG: hypothetical protein QNK37_08765 [Acidobacteriota bacterium]|nr:hypothetical protein [Acidobacteriota bacterium]
MKNIRENAKLTQKKLESQTGKKGERHIISDTEIAGFRAVIGENTKTFILERRITGVTTAPQKFTIGQYPARKSWSLRPARKANATSSAIPKSLGSAP